MNRSQMGALEENSEDVMLQEGALSTVKQMYANLVDTYGHRFVRFLGVFYFSVKGLAYSTLCSVQLPLFKSMGVSGITYQLAGVVLMTPWSTKSWIGVMSDCFPIYKYHKRDYLVLSSTFGVLGMVGLLVLVRGVRPSPAIGCWVAAICLLLTNFQFATFDLLTEGKYAELMRLRGGGAEVLTLVWSGISMGSVASAVITYLVIDKYGVTPLIIISLLPMIVVSYFACRGDVPEEPARSRRTLMKKLHSSPRLFGLALFMALGSVTVALAAAFAPSARIRLAITLCVIVFLSCMSFRALPLTLALSNLYLFLTGAVYLDLSGPLSYYYTAGPTCVPGGPNFSYGYYLAVGKLVGSVAGSLASVLFQGMKHWTFRQAFCLTTMVQVAASIFDIVIIQRWNLLVGISDQSMYLFGDAACQSLACMLIVMPQSLLTSRLCPRGREATVYAVLAGFANFGNNVSSVIGSWLAEELGIDSSGAATGMLPSNAACDFSSLPAALFVCHMVLPLLLLPLTFVMVPDVRMDDEKAFEVEEPPPSLCSPNSPLTSPRSPHAWPDEIERGGYEELPDTPPAFVSKISMTWDDDARTLDREHATSVH